MIQNVLTKGYRHTINHENSSAVQTNLKQMLAAPKHNTLDIHSQNLAIQHLRNQVRPDPTYEISQATTI